MSAARRPTFQTRVIRMVGPREKATAVAAANNAPIDPERPIELVLREVQKTRGMDANAAMWCGPLKDLAEQAWVGGRQFTAEVWHEWYKREFLPEDDDPELHLLAKEGYRKWDYDPSGERVLVGSTTQLTVRGFSQYLRQVEAHGASLGVQFRASPKMAGMR